MTADALLTPERLDRFLADLVEDSPAHDGDTPPAVATAAEAWRVAGLRAGDLVLLGLSNSRAMLAQMFAVLVAGGVPAIVPASAPSARLGLVAKEFGARAIALPRLPSPNEWEVERVARVAGCSDVAWLRADTYAATAAGEIVLLTSGTSGLASGCVHSVDALLRNAAKHADAIGLRAGDVMLVTLPLHFSYALVAQVFAALVRSARLVLSTPPFNPRAYADSVRRHGVTVSSLTPMLLQTLLADEVSLDHGLRVLTVGGDALAPSFADRWLARHPHSELYVTYGLTEAGPRVTTLAVHAEPSSRWTSVGQPLPGTRLRVGDDDELLVSSDTLMKRRIGAVEGAKRLEWRAPGVLATGDVGSIDAAGYLSLRGRRSEFILNGGEKIYLGSVRRLMATLPGVIRAETPLVHERDGKAYELVLHVQPDARHAALKREVSRLLRPAERPRAVRLVAGRPQVVSAFK
jgi:long-chain acyl-CoA synthetase